MSWNRASQGVKRTGEQFPVLCSGEARRGRPPRSSQRGDFLPVGSAATGNLHAEPYRYTMADLEAESGLPARTIRYYITQGLLPPARGRGADFLDRIGRQRGRCRGAIRGTKS